MEKTEDIHHRSAKLRELEEELLGGGTTLKAEEKEEQGKDTPDSAKMEEGEEEDYGRAEGKGREMG